MGKKSRRGKDAKKWKEMSDTFLKDVDSASAKASEMEMPIKAQSLYLRTQQPCTPEELTELYRGMIATTETDMKANDEDIYGDGDQRRLRREPECQVFRNIWADGGGMEMFLMPHVMARGLGLTPLGMACVTGNPKQATAILEAAKDDEFHKLRLLEYRQSVLRLPALLLCIALSKHSSIVSSYTGQPISEMDHVGAAKVLLLHGARPDAKDVSGKNATHHGAGSMSNETTLKIAEMCIEAAKTCKYYGKTVTLEGLSKAAYNGLTGQLGGYLVDQGRRIVHVALPSGNDSCNTASKELSILPKNIVFEGKPILDESFKLHDIPDRLGSVPLHEVIMGQRVDVAQFLCDKHNASLDIPDLTGLTPRKMVFGMNSKGLVSSAMEAIRNYAFHDRDRSRICKKCQKTIDKRDSDEKLKSCTRCKNVYYCSRDCQLADWKDHKKDCQDLSKGIVLQHPDQAGLSEIFANGSAGIAFQPFSRNGVFDEGKFQKPSTVRPGEKFWTKVQITHTGNGPHLVYDYTGECWFHMMPGQPGYEELRERVRVEPVSIGRKCHFKASFDEEGNCTVFPFTAKLLAW